MSYKVGSMLRVTTVNRPTNNYNHPKQGSTIVQLQVFNLSVDYMVIIWIKEKELSWDDF